VVAGHWAPVVVVERLLGSLGASQRRWRAEGRANNRRGGWRAEDRPRKVLVGGGVPKCTGASCCLCPVPLALARRRERRRLRAGEED
jgi:hypothetical protein